MTSEQAVPMVTISASLRLTHERLVRLNQLLKHHQEMVLGYGPNQAPTTDKMAEPNCQVQWCAAIDRELHMAEIVTERFIDTSHGQKPEPAGLRSGAFEDCQTARSQVRG